jgi:hypothetical protein
MLTDIRHTAEQNLACAFSLVRLVRQKNNLLDKCSSISLSIRSRYATLHRTTKVLTDRMIFLHIIDPFL